MGQGTDYERFVQRVYQAFVAEAQQGIEVLHDVKLEGKGTTHQVDVMWTFELAGVRHRVVVECKDRGRPREKNEIMAFKALLDDLPGACQGIFVSRSGFQSGAIDYAKQYDITLCEIREPQSGDWLKNEFLEVGLHITLEEPEFAFQTVEFDRAWLTARYPPGTQFQVDLRRSSPIFRESGEMVETFGQFLQRHYKTLEPDATHTLAFEPGTFVMTTNEAVPRAPVLRCTFSYKLTSTTSSTVIDFRRQVKAVINDVIKRTQVRFADGMRPSGPINRDD